MFIYQTLGMKAFPITQGRRVIKVAVKLMSAVSAWVVQWVVLDDYGHPCDSAARVADSPPVSRVDQSFTNSVKRCRK